MVPPGSQVGSGSHRGTAPAGAEDPRREPQARKKRPASTTARPAAADPPRLDQPPSARRRRLWLLLSLGPCALSMIVHVVATLGLSLIIVPREEHPSPLSIVVSASEEESFEEPAEVDIEPVEEVRLEELPVEAAPPDPGALALGDVVQPAATDAVDIGALATAGPSIADLGAEFGADAGSGLGSSGVGAGAVAMTFFGKKTAPGKKFVFVCDNSNSMGNGRFETVLVQLMKSVNDLGKNQSFFVYFFSDTSYPLFHPTPATAMVPATPETKEKLAQWLQTVEMCLHTSPQQAITSALELQPDVICLLTDGAFSDKTEPLLTAPHNRRTVIHTFGMNAPPDGVRCLTDIAKANGGEYTAVDVLPEAKAMAKAKPIPRNKTRGSVWGLKLRAADDK